MRRVDIRLSLDNFEEGDVQRVFLNLAKEFIEHDFEVDIVLSKSIESFNLSYQQSIEFLISSSNPHLSGREVAFDV